MPAPAAAPAIPIAFTMGNALTGLGTGLALAHGTHISQRIYGYITSDGNGGSVFVPTQEQLMGGATGSGLMMNDPILAPAPKKRRKRSKYQMEFGRSMKALKKKHPRTPVSRLMKRAHTMTKKKMRRK